MVLFSGFSRSKFLATGSNTNWVLFPVSLRWDMPGNMVFGLINLESWGCNPIDVGVLQSRDVVV